MINFKILIKTIYIYVIAYLALLITILGLMYFIPRLELHMLLNSYHTSIQDTFFKYYSTLAEWPLYIIAMLPIIWKKIKATLFFAMCEMIGGGILQILKHTFCSDRPICVFEHCNNIVLPIVQGVTMHHSNSFPSGHASTFFMFCTCCVIILAYYYRRNPKVHNRMKTILFNATLFVLLTLAAIGAYSRVYLSQHFLSDVCVGSIIGFVTPFLIFYLCKDKILKLKIEK